VELTAQKPGVIGELDHLHEFAVGAHTGDHKPVVGELLQILLIDLVAVTVPLADLGHFIGPVGQGPLLELAGICAETHGAAHLLDSQQIAQLVDDGVGSVGIELGGGGVLDPTDVACVLDNHALHTEADAKERYLVLTGIAHGVDLAGGAARTKADGHQQSVDLEHLPRPVARLDVLGAEIHQLHLGVVGDAAVHQGLVEALVGVGELHILADDPDADMVLGILDLADQRLPLRHVARVLGQVQDLEQDLVQTLAAEAQRYLVDGVDVTGGDDLARLDIAEERDLALDIFGQRTVAAAEQGIGGDTDGSELAYRVLGRLCLELVGGGDKGYESQMEVGRVVTTQLEPQLPDRLEEGERLDVSDRAADLDDHHIHALGQPQHGFFDLVGDMRNHLDGLAQIVATPFLVDDRFVDLAGGVVVSLAGQRVGKALVVAKIQIGLGTIVGDKDLTMLVGRHGPRVDVDVGVELHQGDRETSGLEDGAHRGRGHTLAQRRYDSTRHKNELGRHTPVSSDPPG
jgi:hypothetical protein